jgi:hypothetical protein
VKLLEDVQRLARFDQDAALSGGAGHLGEHGDGEN